MKTDKKLSRQDWINEQNKRAQLILKRKEREKTKAIIQNITEEEHPYSGPYFGYSDYAEDAGIYGYDLD